MPRLQRLVSQKITKSKEHALIVFIIFFMALATLSMLVRDCYVDDGEGGQVKVIDEDG